MLIAQRIRILLLHDDSLARAGLSATFGRYSDLDVIDASDVREVDSSTLRKAARAADVVVADYDHGIRLASLVARDPDARDPCKIMIVATVDREWEIRGALEHGVWGYVLIGCALDELASGVRAVHNGARYLSPRVAQRLAESLSTEPLTRREEEVLRLVAQGMGNKSIARRLNIAVGTTKSHLKGVFEKLGVHSRTQAICAAERRGLLSAAHMATQTATATGTPPPRIEPLVEEEIS
jgi:DNA-binding NarL/FixJ family response regulator